MNESYAIVESGVVTNIAPWDGASAWAPPSGTAVVVIAADTFVDIGHIYNGATFALL